MKTGAFSVDQNASIFPSVTTVFFKALFKVPLNCPEILPSAFEKLLIFMNVSCPHETEGDIIGYYGS